MQNVMALMESPSYRMSLARRLEAERERANNGTIPGGLASMVNAGTAAFLRMRDEGDRRRATEAYTGGMSEGADIGTPDGQQPNAPRIMPGAQAAESRLSALGPRNPYATRLAGMLAADRMAAEQEAAARQQQFQQQLYRDSINNDARMRAAAAGRSNINVTTGVPNDPLLETLGKEEGKAWGGYLAAGNDAVSKMQDLDALGELVETIPSGPLTGRLAEMFRGFSDSTAAFQSVISRIAPQMRVPGSGATSDKEVSMFLEALPSLRNRPEANRAIVQMLKNKAQLDIERQNIVTSVANGVISPQEGRRAMVKLNQTSVMPDSLRQTLRSLGGGQGGDIGNGIRAMPNEGGGQGGGGRTRFRYNPETNALEPVR